MYWTNKDLDLVSTKVNEVFGPQGRYSDVNPNFFNVRITSDRYGHLWYGDMDSLQEIESKCLEIKKQLASFNFNQLPFGQTEDFITASIYTQDDLAVVTV